MQKKSPDRIAFEQQKTSTDRIVSSSQVIVLPGPSGKLVVPAGTIRSFCKEKRNCKRSRKTELHSISKRSRKTELHSISKRSRKTELLGDTAKEVERPKCYLTHERDRKIELWEPSLSKRSRKTELLGDTAKEVERPKCYLTHERDRKIELW